MLVNMPTTTSSMYPKMKKLLKFCLTMLIILQLGRPWKAMEELIKKAFLGFLNSTFRLLRYISFALDKNRSLSTLLVGRLTRLFAVRWTLLVGLLNKQVNTCLYWTQTLIIWNYFILIGCIQHLSTSNKNFLNNKMK